MRVIRYLFLLLSAVVMTGLFAGQAHAATVQKDNEISDSQTPTQTQSNKVEGVVTQSESTTSETTSQTKTVIGDVSGSDNIPITNLSDAKTELPSAAAQQSNSPETTAGIIAAQQAKTSSAAPRSYTSSFGLNGNSSDVQYAGSHTDTAAQTSLVSTNTQTPATPTNVPGSNNGLLLLASMLKPVTTFSGSNPYVPVSQDKPTTLNTAFTLIAVGIILVVGLLSASQMSMRKQGFNSAARGAGLRMNRLFSISKRELLSDYSVSGSLFSIFNFGFKTNMYLLKGGTI